VLILIFLSSVHVCCIVVWWYDLLHSHLSLVRWSTISDWFCFGDLFTFDWLFVTDSIWFLRYVRYVAFRSVPYVLALPVCVVTFSVRFVAINHVDFDLFCFVFFFFFFSFVCVVRYVRTFLPIFVVLDLIRFLVMPVADNFFVRFCSHSFSPFLVCVHRFLGVVTFALRWFSVCYAFLPLRYVDCFVLRWTFYADRCVVRVYRCTLLFAFVPSTVSFTLRCRFRCLFSWFVFVCCVHRFVLGVLYRSLVRSLIRCLFYHFVCCWWVFLWLRCIRFTRCSLRYSTRCVTLPFDFVCCIGRFDFDLVHVRCSWWFPTVTSFTIFFFFVVLRSFGAFVRSLVGCVSAFLVCYVHGPVDLRSPDRLSFIPCLSRSICVHLRSTWLRSLRFLQIRSFTFSLPTYGRFVFWFHHVFCVTFVVPLPFYLFFLFVLRYVTGLHSFYTSHVSVRCCDSLHVVDCLRYGTFWSLFVASYYRSVRWSLFVPILRSIFVPTFVRFVCDFVCYVFLLTLFWVSLHFIRPVDCSPTFVWFVHSVRFFFYLPIHVDSVILRCVVVDRCSVWVLICCSIHLRCLLRFVVAIRLRFLRFCLPLGALTFVVVCTISYLICVDFVFVFLLFVTFDPCFFHLIRYNSILLSSVCCFGILFILRFVPICSIYSFTISHSIHFDVVVCSSISVEIVFIPTFWYSFSRCWLFYSLLLFVDFVTFYIVHARIFLFIFFYVTFVVRCCLLLLLLHSSLQFVVGYVYSRCVVDRSVCVYVVCSLLLFCCLFVHSHLFGPCSCSDFHSDSRLRSGPRLISLVVRSPGDLEYTLRFYRLMFSTFRSRSSRLIPVLRFVMFFGVRFRLRLRSYRFFLRLFVVVVPVTVLSFVCCSFVRLLSRFFFFFFFAFPTFFFCVHVQISRIYSRLHSTFWAFCVTFVRFTFFCVLRLFTRSIPVFAFAILHVPFTICSGSSFCVLFYRSFDWLIPLRYLVPFTTFDCRSLFLHSIRAVRFLVIHSTLFCYIRFTVFIRFARSSRWFVRCWWWYSFRYFNSLLLVTSPFCCYIPVLRCFFFILTLLGHLICWSIRLFVAIVLHSGLRSSVPLRSVRRFYVCCWCWSHIQVRYVLRCFALLLSIWSDGDSLLFVDSFALRLILRSRCVTGPCFHVFCSGFDDVTFVVMVIYVVDFVLLRSLFDFFVCDRFFFSRWFCCFYVDLVVTFLDTFFAFDFALRPLLRLDSRSSLQLRLIPILFDPRFYIGRFTFRIITTTTRLLFRCSVDFFASFVHVCCVRFWFLFVTSCVAFYDSYLPTSVWCIHSLHFTLIIHSNRSLRSYDFDLFRFDSVLSTVRFFFIRLLLLLIVNFVRCNCFDLGDFVRFCSFYIRLLHCPRLPFIQSLFVLVNFLHIHVCIYVMFALFRCLLRYVDLFRSFYVYRYVPPTTVRSRFLRWFVPLGHVLPLHSVDLEFLRWFCRCPYVFALLLLDSFTLYVRYVTSCFRSGPVVCSFVVLDYLRLRF